MTKKAKILTGVAVAAVVLVLAAVLGPMIYARSQAAAPAPLTVDETASSQAPTPASSSASAAESNDTGTWQVGDDSQAGYRVDEVLNNNDVTVVGRTDEVTGSAEVSNGQLTSTTITVDVASIKTDSDRRDGYFKQNAMKTDQYPTATFKLTEPVAIPALGEKKVTVKATGDLTLAGKSKEVTADIAVVRDGEDVKASGNVPVTFSDWDIEAPNLGFVKVENSGQIEFLVVLEK